MELRTVKTFIRTAELMNFTKAAEELGYAQSTITMQIHQLEKELGAALFERNGTQISLSADGKAFLPFAYRLAGCEASALDYFSGGGVPEGELRVGMIESLSCSRYKGILIDFMKECPGVKLRVTIGTTLEILSLLEHGTLDLIVTLDRRVGSANFAAAAEKREEILFFCAEDYGLPEGTLDMDALLPENWILTEPGCNYRRDFEEFLAERKAQVRDVLEVGSTEIVIGAVKEKLGISLLPGYCLEGAEKNSLRILPVEDYRLFLYIQLVHFKSRRVSPAMKAFFQCAARYFD